MNRIKPLDGIRGIAVIMVLIAHAPYIDGAGIVNDALFAAKKSGFGYIGVELFFILSGYLITSGLISLIQSGDPNILGRFFEKRVYRLAPVIIISVFGCWLLMPGYDYLPTLFFASNYYFSVSPDPHPLRHFWSLAVEEQFYIFWPFLLIATRLDPDRVKALFLFIVGFSVASILVRDLLLADEVSRNLIYRSLESRMIALTLGGALAFYGVPAIKLRWLALAGAVSLGIAAAAIVAAKAGVQVPLATIKAFSYLVFSACVFLSAFSPWLNVPLSNTALRHAGTISFGLYVYHLPIFYWFGISHMQTSEPVNVATALSALSVTIAVTLASWHLIEKPVLGIKNRRVALQ